MVFTTQCPQCAKILWFSSKLAGTITICPACGSTMRLPVFEAPPPVVPADGSTPAPPEAEDRVPAVVEQSTLTHQAAAAVGEVQVDVDESDLVQWAQPQPSTSPPIHAPAWAPPPLSGPSAPPSEQPWPGPAQPPPATSYLKMPTLEERRESQKVMLQVAGSAVGVFLLLIGLIWMLSPSRNIQWDKDPKNLDQILTLKQSAEELALQQRYRESFEAYTELQRFVEGHDITDPALQADLDKARQRKDAVYDLALGIGTATRPAAPAFVAPANVVPQQHSEAPAPVAVMPVVATAPTSNPSVATNLPHLGPHPVPHPSTQQSSGLTDEQIGAAITHGADFLLAQFGDADVHNFRNSEYHDGMECLAVYALMQSGMATGDKRLDIHGPFLSSAIDFMKKLTMDNGYITYSRALRSTALALFDRDEDHATIKADVDWLLRAQYGGGYTYTDQFPRLTDFSFWDNSNSQYGLLGVWSGAEVGVQVNATYWKDVEQHWSGCQLPDGEWAYRANDPTPRRSMTLAGVASLFVTQDYLDPERYGTKIGRPPFSPALQRGLTWLEDDDNSVVPLNSQYDYYTLYGLERAGLASGFKYFGSHDWYREQAAQVISLQHPDGSWPAVNEVDQIINTSYALLFLARGRHPITMTKLRFDGDWANRPRDVANLTRFAARELERPLNWQVIPIDHDWHDWTDSRILYLASDKAPPVTDTQVDELRAYIQNGGLLLLQADGGSADFNSFAVDLGQRLFPQYPWTDLPPDSPLGTAAYKLTNPPPMKIISNGSRILVMQWPMDISSHWQLREEKASRSFFELGVDLALYAAGKTELQNRISNDLPPPLENPEASITLARLKYDGNWNPEPAAWPREARLFGQQTSLGLNFDTIALEDLSTKNPPIAHLTGTAHFAVTDAQIASVKQYVENGGVLLIDPCGTPGDFFNTVHDDLLAKAFPDIPPEPIVTGHPLLMESSVGMDDIQKPTFREFVRTLTDTSHTTPMVIRAGAGHVILLPLDLTSGLLDEQAWGIAGYRPDYCKSFAKNLLLWTWDGAKD
jgi:hypothetical protein